MNIQRIKRIAWFALFGAIGFGLGYWARAEPILEGFTYLGISGLFVPGALGGASLGLASRKGFKKILFLTAMGGVGFVIGSLASFICLGLTGGESLWARPYIAIIAIIIANGISGASVGAALGFVLGGRRIIIGLAIAGALSFILGYFITYVLIPWPRNLYPTKFTADLIYLYLQRILPGVLSGAFFGAAFGLLEKGKAGATG